MSVEDFRINAFVRQVLSRSWVDLQRVKFGTVGETVYFHGRFEKMRARNPTPEEPWNKPRPENLAEDMALLDKVEREIRRNPTVKDVVFRFENFRKVRGAWVASGE